MSLELLNTLTTLATCVIVATTAIAALIQLRHLRASNQIQGQLAISELIQSEEFRRAQITIAAYASDFYDDMVVGSAKLMTVGAILSSSVVSDHVIYVGSADGNLYALI